MNPDCSYCSFKDGASVEHPCVDKKIKDIIDNAWGNYHQQWRLVDELKKKLQEMEVGHAINVVGWREERDTWRSGCKSRDEQIVELNAETEQLKKENESLKTRVDSALKGEHENFEAYLESKKQLSLSRANEAKMAGALDKIRKCESPKYPNVATPYDLQKIAINALSHSPKSLEVVKEMFEALKLILEHAKEEWGVDLSAFEGCELAEKAIQKAKDFFHV